MSRVALQHPIAKKPDGAAPLFQFPTRHESAARHPDAIAHADTKKATVDLSNRLFGDIRS
jgi:hypothetical protein